MHVLQVDNGHEVRQIDAEFEEYDVKAETGSRGIDTLKDKQKQNIQRQLPESVLTEIRMRLEKERHKEHRNENRINELRQKQELSKIDNNQDQHTKDTQLLFNIQQHRKRRRKHGISRKGTHRKNKKEPKTKKEQVCVAADYLHHEI